MKTIDDIFANSMPVPHCGCWIWMGAISGTNGYGNVRSNGRYWGAHRLAYTVAKGEPPRGLYLDHLCRVRACVNPDHLDPVTPLENVRRSPLGITSRLGDSCRARVSCPAGHPYSDENTYYRKDGSRQCRACQKVRNKSERCREQRRLAQARYRQRKREEDTRT